MRAATSDPYAVLGVNRGATEAEIRQAYRTAARQHHPDVGGSAAKMATLTSARDALLSSAPSASDTSAPRPRNPISTVGTPGLVADGPHGDAGRIGAAGERIVAVRIAHAGLPHHAVLANGIVAGDRGGDVDHAVLLGDHALFIDTKTWAPGTYSVRGGVTYRDGTLAPHAQASTTLPLALMAADRLSIDPGHARVVVVVTDRSGSSAGLRLHIAHPEMQIIGIDDLDSYLARWSASVVAQDALRAVDPARLDAAWDLTDGEVVHAPTPPPDVSVSLTRRLTSRTPWSTDVEAAVARACRRYDDPVRQANAMRRWAQGRDLDTDTEAGQWLAGQVTV